MESGERRGSLGRVLDKLRAAVKRRRRPTANAAEAHPVEEVAVDTTRDSAGNVALSSTTQPHDSDARPVIVSHSPPLIADDGEVKDEDDVDEALLPVEPNRHGREGDRARALFERYGLSYEARRRLSEHEPPAKMRRIEKPVRMRIHWKCHECDGHFAQNMTCVACGHRRCAECRRSPARKVREIMESTRQMVEREDQRQRASLEHKKSAGLMPRPMSSEPLEKDDAPEEEDAVYTQTYKWVMQSPPKVDLVQRPKTQIIRRACHKCETPFLPANRTECENCNHTRCSLCPRHPAKAEKWPAGSPGDEKAPLEEVRVVQTVQRVYKKPRQRVRYACEHCRTVFVGRTACTQCGHQRCRDCTRNPPRQSLPTPDAALLRSVAERLATYDFSEPPASPSAAV